MSWRGERVRKDPNEGKYKASELFTKDMEEASSFAFTATSPAKRRSGQFPHYPQTTLERERVSRSQALCSNTSSDPEALG